jgi:hypothetical protein
MPPGGIVTSPLRSLGPAVLGLALLLSVTPAHAAVQPDPRVRHATTMGSVGVARQVSDVMRAQALADASGQRPERDAEEKEDAHEHVDRTHLAQNPASPFVSAFGDLSRPARTSLGTEQVLSPQTIGLSFTGATLSGTNPTSSFPPDCMGAVGPTQYVVFVNGRLVTFNKTTGVADGVLNADPDVFFASVKGSSYTSDPRIRYDRLTGRWFLIIINTSTPNRILFAVSDAAGSGTITGSTTFTYYYIPIDTTPPTISSTCFADYPTLGLDANALYVGTNNFCGAQGNYDGTDGYVVRKSSIMGAGPIVVTAFRQLATASGAGPYTPQGVDNYDPAATEGYFIGTDNVSYGLLQLRRVSNPGGTPTLSSNISITVPATGAPLNSPHLGNTRGTIGYLDALDDRLFAAHIRNGQLWTAHNIGVNNTGVASGTLTRDGSRWYQINVPAGSGTPTLVQSGTVYTASGSNTADQRNYWIPSVMVSGQGHAAIGFSTAGTNERANTGTVGRYASDAAGAMQTPALITSSSTAYNPSGDPGSSGYGRRWGDYSYTSLDPLDDMTMWTVGMFCNATNSYGVRVTKLVAPPPATPGALADVTAGQNPVTLTLTGTSSSGSGYYDPGANLPGVPGFSHLAAAISAGGATGTPPGVVSATYLTPTTIQLVLNASTATANVGSEKYAITVTNPDGQTAAGAVVHVVGSSPTVTIAAGPTQAEGNSGASTFDFTVNLSSAATAPVVVRYHTADGTATAADADYLAASDSITIATGQSSGAVPVTVHGDTKYENGETFTVTLDSATNATLGGTVTATGTITNDDSQPAINIVATAATAEGDSGTTPLVFGVTLSNPSAFVVSAGYATADNSATTADGDYQSASGTMTFPAGQTSGDVSVDVVGDAKYENNESFTVTLSAPAGATLGDAVATGTITNDDAMPTLSVDDVSHLEGNGGTTLFRFTVSLSMPSGLPASADFATADGTATVAGGDYQATTGSLLFAAGTTSRTLGVLVNGDATQEPDETFTVALSNPTSATLAPAPGTGTIRNDDATPLLSLAGVSALEGRSGLTPLGFTVHLTNPSAQAVTVDYATSDGTATLANGDYLAGSGVLEIPAMATSASITVDAVGDSCGEADETFTLTLSNATNAAIDTAAAAGTILNDDEITAPAVTVVGPNGSEALEVMSPMDITWTASDSAGVTGVDILLSRDDGATYPEILAAGLPNNGLYTWTVTPPATTAALIQVKAHDNACNMGSDVSDAAFQIADHVTAADGGGPVVAFALGTVRPNPSRGSVQFGYQLPHDASVRLSIVDVQGREVALIANGSVGAGRHTATWSGRAAGGQVPRGLFFVRYAAGGKVFTRRFALVR